MSKPATFLVLEDTDDLGVALRDLAAGATPEPGITLRDTIPAKHKYTRRALAAGDQVRMYGVTVGQAAVALPTGSLVTTDNLTHATDALGEEQSPPYNWVAPTLPTHLPRTFAGYHRADGRIGTANVWLVVPLVFCENRNVDVLRRSLEDQLGFGGGAARFDLSAWLAARQAGATAEALANTPITDRETGQQQSQVNPHFPNVDGLRFLTHEAGCGGTRGDASRLIELLAGYLTHPNVGGATVLSLGCQNAEVQQLLGALHAGARSSPKRGAKEGIAPQPPKGERRGSVDTAQFTLSPERDGVTTYHLHHRPIVVAEQQRGTHGESAFLAETIRQTLAGLDLANRTERRPAAAHHLTLGLECGGSDGFSGLTANPMLGVVSDWLVGLGGRSLLAEFPELNGVERELIRRCTRPADAHRFRQLMADYGAAAKRVGSSFADNPSPGNIREGLITDAMKSAGAARKGGTAPVAAVLDYAEIPRRAGLSLLCTPGNDVESTTALAASHANLIAFTTGLGTPTGNPAAPVLKVASNSRLAREQPDLIDFDAGVIVDRNVALEDAAAQFWRRMIATASGEYVPAATQLRQFDFIPWRRDISL